MKIIVVVSHPQDWPVRIPGVEVMPARRYLTGAACNAQEDVKIFNLCRSYGYQRRGYYVSLLAQARGHCPVPDVKAIEDLESSRLLHGVLDPHDELLQTALADVIPGTLPDGGSTYTMNIYFGRDASRRHAHLAEQLCNLLHVPLLQVRFAHDGRRWRLDHARALPLPEIPASDLQTLRQSAMECMRAHLQRPREPAAQRPSVAILHTPGEHGQPSDSRALQHFCEAAEMLGMRTDIITQADADRLPQFDALFIRDTTCVNHYTYQLARQAALSGLVVMDDPDSILKCCNKVYLAELLARHDIPAPKTMMVHHENVDRIIPELGLPCILKQPDSAFSVGVVRAGSRQELDALLPSLLAQSEIIIAQEYLPTGYDWRIGILDNKPIFACKYYMVPGHWQIMQHGASGACEEGRTEAIPLADVPEHVLHTALRSASLIGDGFYGVDLKQRGQHCFVIEINDNPNVDAGNEDGVAGQALYQDIMRVFRDRIEQRKHRLTP